MLARSLTRTLRRHLTHDPVCAIRTPVRLFTDLSVGLSPSAESNSKDSQSTSPKKLKIIRKIDFTRSLDAWGKYEQRFTKNRPRRMSGPPFNDLKYYTFGTPNGLKPAIVLEELGLKYEAITVDISKNTQKEDWFLAINPNGRIPALKDGEMRVFESGAIMMYLADYYDKSEAITYKHGTPLYYEMLSWLMFQMGGIGPMQGMVRPDSPRA